MKGSNWFRTVLIALAVLSANAMSANDNWYQHAVVSPDGEQIAFSAKGDIYLVSTAGGEAIPIVTDAHWDGHPVWSNDGKSIAFATDRNGSLDVYHLELDSRAITRLTYHSTNDYPTDFMKDDKHVVFSSSRIHAAQSSDFPTPALPQLYSVSIQGGTPSMVLTHTALQAQLSTDDEQLVYMDNKAYENQYRKHDVSSFARDIWLYDMAKQTHTQLTTFVGGDSNPVWGGSDLIYYLSEDEKNNFNVWKMDADGDSKERLTDHELHPVRSLSASENGVLAYTWHGNLYVLKDAKEPTLLDVKLVAPKVNLKEQMTSIANEANRFALSPNGKEVAFIARGELFVSSIEFGTTVRLTDTPEQERTISWFPDGKSLAVAAERDGSWGIYKIAIADETEPYFFAATKFAETTLINEANDEFQPLISPDGKRMAYLNVRDEIRVMDLASGKSNAVFPAKYNSSYADGDIFYQWSPDSRWLAASYIARGMYFFSSIGVAPADGSEAPRDISLSGYVDFAPQWTDGGSIQYISGRYGRRNHGSWGADLDIMSVFLTQDSFEAFTLSKEERALKAELEEAAEKAEEGDESAEKKDQDEKPVEPIDIDWENLDKRTLRLTKHSSNFDEVSGINFGFSENQEKLYYLAKFEKGLDLWVEDFKEKSTKLALKLNAKSASMQIDKEGKFALILADGQLSKVELSGEHKKTGVSYQGNIALNESRERAYMFEHIWRQTDDKFYNDNMHGIDWDKMYDEYYPKAANAQNNLDFATITSEMLGELNASHTGTYYRFNPPPEVQTASLGVIYAKQPSDDGIRIEEILSNSPLVKHSNLVKPGSVLTHIDGQQVSKDKNLSHALMGKAGVRTRLTVNTDNETHQIVVKPVTINDERDGLYERWVDSRRALVDKLSNGQLGYIHLPRMNDAAYRSAYAEIFGRSFDKKALVVDTRFNQGGWLTDDMVTLLSGKQYTWAVIRDNKFKGDSMKRWTKPSLVVMNEGNYSDGYCFPKGYKANNIGKTVGMPVPGTCTAVWWETLQSGDLVFGIPQVGITDMEGTYLENNQLEPDVKVMNEKAAVAKGKDSQLEVAVKELMKEI